jgi:hypothetical protein
MCAEVPYLLEDLNLARLLANGGEHPRQLVKLVLHDQPPFLQRCTSWTYGGQSQSHACTASLQTPPAAQTDALVAQMLERPKIKLQFDALFTLNFSLFDIYNSYFLKNRFL